MAEQSAAGEVVAERPTSTSSNFSLPSPSPPQSKRSLLKSLKKLLTPSQAAVLTPLDFPQNTIPTPSEASENSFCSENITFKQWKTIRMILIVALQLSMLSSEGMYDNVEDGLENCESSSVLDALSADSSDHFSSDVFGQMVPTRDKN